MDSPKVIHLYKYLAKGSLSIGRDSDTDLVPNFAEEILGKNGYITPKREDLSAERSVYLARRPGMIEFLGNDYNAESPASISSVFSSLPVSYVSHTDALSEMEIHKYLASITQEFLSIAYEDDFEFGFTSNCERYVKNLLQENRINTMSWLSSVFLKNTANTRIVTAILHVISHLNYQIIYPEGQMIALSALSHKSIEVRECAVRAFENWGNSDSLNILRNIKCEEQWLADYIKLIISDLEREIYLNVTTDKTLCRRHGRAQKQREM